MTHILLLGRSEEICLKARELEVLMSARPDMKLTFDKGEIFCFEEGSGKFHVTFGQHPGALPEYQGCCRLVREHCNGLQCKQLTS